MTMKTSDGKYTIFMVIFGISVVSSNSSQRKRNYNVDSMWTDKLNFEL